MASQPLGRLSVNIISMWFSVMMGRSWEFPIRWSLKGQCWIQVYDASPCFNLWYWSLFHALDWWAISVYRWPPGNIGIWSIIIFIRKSQPYTKIETVLILTHQCQDPGGWHIYTAANLVIIDSDNGSSSIPLLTYCQLDPEQTSVEF